MSRVFQELERVKEKSSRQRQQLKELNKLIEQIRKRNQELEDRRREDSKRIQVLEMELWNI